MKSPALTGIRAPKLWRPLDAGIVLSSLPSAITWYWCGVPVGRKTLSVITVCTASSAWKLHTVMTPAEGVAYEGPEARPVCSSS
jgi:hypothetical protein